MGMIAGLLVLIVAGFGLYVRLAPSDPARWHVTPAPAARSRLHVSKHGTGDARATCLRPQIPGATACAA